MYQALEVTDLTETSVPMYRTANS